MLRKDNEESPFTLTAVVLTVVVVGFLWWARTILIPLALAIFLTFILAPGVSRLRRLNLGRMPSVALVVLGFLIALGGVGWLVSSQMTSLVQELPDHAGKIRTKLHAAREWLSPGQSNRVADLVNDVGQAAGLTKPNTDQPVVVQMETALPHWLGNFEGYLSPAVEFLGLAALTVILLFFLLMSKEDMRNRVIRLIGPSRLMLTTKAVDDAGSRVSRYLRMQFLINTCFGGVVAIALLLIGVRYAILWGFIAGLMRYLPYIGTWVGLVPAFLSAVAMSEGWGQPIAVLLSYGIIELVVNAIVEPRLFGKSLGLSEVAQVFSAAFWGFLWGPLGLILSGPLTACLLVLARNVPQLHGLEVLLGDEEPLPRHVAFFQRLMARDRDEAERIADEYTVQHTAEKTIDELLLSALGRTQAARERREMDDDDVAFVLQAVDEIGTEIKTAVPPIAENDDQSRIRILLAPASGLGDEFAAKMLLAQLDNRRWEVDCLATATLVSEAIAAVQGKQPPVVVIVSLAPGGFAHTRYLCKRLHAGVPDVKLIVGRWGSAGQSENEQIALEAVGIDEVTRSLSETRQVLHNWRPVLLARSVVAEPKPEKVEQIGTASAAT